MRVRVLQVSPFRVHVAGPLEVLLRPEGRRMENFRLQNSCGTVYLMTMAL